MTAPKIKLVPRSTVIGSETLTGPNGTAALCLNTREFGQIAFAIDERAIANIRKHLDKLELSVRNPKRRA
jgi:hypothetical protein